MSYNLKCCSFYPNNFDASALKKYQKVIVPRPRYACTSVGVHVSFGRGTHVPRSGYDDNEAFLRRLSGEKEKTKHVKRENNSCEKEKRNRLRGF